MTLDLGRFQAMTFDCYGTLIDWETGLLSALGQLFAPHTAEPPDESILESFAHHEARLEAGPFRPYREVLTEVARALCDEAGVEASEAELSRFAGSVGDWPAFPDSAEALAALSRRYRLGVVTNCDDDLFAASQRRLGVIFDPVVTAQQVRSYKPAARHFEVALERLDLSREAILHVAQSLFHDHVPAVALGLSTVWVDRRHDRQGAGATPPAEAAPDLVVPDLATLADLAASQRIAPETQAPGTVDR
jgi:2-haloacid dehalogenase